MGAIAVKAVSDTGPLIHLQEIKATKCANIFEAIFIPPEVEKELSNAVAAYKKLKKIELSPNAKDYTALLVEKFNLDLGESEALALAKQLKISLLLTDDLEARETAKQIYLKPVGTIGIIIASFKKKVISKQKCIEILKSVKANSSLFITQELINYAIEQVTKY